MRIIKAILLYLKVQYSRDIAITNIIKEQQNKIDLLEIEVNGLNEQIKFLSQTNKQIIDIINQDNPLLVDSLLTEEISN